MHRSLIVRKINHSYSLTKKNKKNSSIPNNTLASGSRESYSHPTRGIKLHPESDRQSQKKNKKKNTYFRERGFSEVKRLPGDSFVMDV